MAPVDDPASRVAAVALLLAKVDPFNCGGCHNVCAQGISCCYGQCQDCPGGSFKCANNVCTNLQTDPQNCGRCGAACPAGAQCINGACSCPPDKPTSCGGICTDTLTDPNHCAGCASACQSAVSNCFDEYFADFMVDPRNCGGCNQLCADGINCCFGQCQDCPGDRPTSCGSICIDTLTDSNHCGACNIGCVPGYSCVEGTCVLNPSPAGPEPAPAEIPLVAEASPDQPSPSPSPSPAQPSPSPAPTAAIPLGGGCSAACGPDYSCSNGECVKTVTFSKPKVNGMRIDYCLAADRVQCGQPAADAFCQQEGFDGALAFKGPINKGPTFFLGSQQICTSTCATFHSIDCRKVAPA
ncbi:hypothetical protein N2152v2_010604 [Parachlorella kessleri]